MSLNPSKKDTTLEAKNALVQNSPVYMFVCTKAERLVTAVHLMTRHIDTTEPLRTSLRTESVSLLTLLHVHDKRLSEDALTERIALVQGLLDAAFHAGFVSQVNYAVVRKEYESLAAFLKTRGGVFGSTEAVVGDVFFNVPEPTLPVPEEPTQVVQTPSLTTPVVKDKLVSQGQKMSKKPVPRQTSQKVERKKTDRRSSILELLNRQEKVSVRDVALVVTGVSEKTLQRELLALVDEGLVKKEGERRWSTYSLKKK